MHDPYSIKYAGVMTSIEYLKTRTLTTRKHITQNSMEDSPFCKYNSRTATQETPLLLWNPNVNYRLHKSHLLGTIQRQMNPVFPSGFRPKFCEHF